jgi:threonine/homoserine/homoserine lactone efflux protein
MATMATLDVRSGSLAIGESTALTSRPPVRKALDRFTGVVLIAFGVRLALERC